MSTKKTKPAARRKPNKFETVAESTRIHYIGESTLDIQNRLEILDFEEGKVVERINTLEWQLRNAKEEAKRIGAMSAGLNLVLAQRR
jgi:hypothetical protein